MLRNARSGRIQRTIMTRHFAPSWPINCDVFAWILLLIQRTVEAQPMRLFYFLEMVFLDHPKNHTREILQKWFRKRAVLDHAVLVGFIKR